MIQDYRDILRQEFVQRQRRNPRYSLSAFSNSLGLKTPHLSAIFSGRKGLSAVSATRIARAMGWVAEETDQFVNLVQAHHARDKSVRQLARSRAAMFSRNKDFSILDLDRFQLVSDWHHFAILHLFELKDFVSDIDWIAHRLELDRKLVGEAVARLEKAGLVLRDRKSGASRAGS